MEKWKQDIIDNSRRRINGQCQKCKKKIDSHETHLLTITAIGIEHEAGLCAQCFIELRNK